MSDDGDFGTLRSLLADPTTDASSFDAVIRHLINWSWHDDPRIFERWLGYAQAHLERWPDEARCLHVRPEDEMFLRDIDAWSSLFRAVSITSADGFFGQFVELVGEGHFSGLTYLKLRDLTLTGEDMEALSSMLGAVEGLALAPRRNVGSEWSADAVGSWPRSRWLDLRGVHVEERTFAALIEATPSLELLAPTTFGISARHAAVLMETGALGRLRALDVGSPHRGALDALLDAGEEVGELTVHVAFLDHVTDASTRRRIVERGWVLADDAAWRALWRERTSGVFGWW
jgi:hypothetical protein